jgi:hypothetical protein
MHDHIHTGFVQLTVAALFTIVAIHVLRMGATWLASQDNDTAQAAGKVIGGLVTFS